MTENDLHSKLEELKNELMVHGLWKKTSPDWVNEFKEYKCGQVKFLDWLQLVYIPNRSMQAIEFPFKSHDNYIALQVKKFAGEEMMDKKIMALLIEIDAI